MPLLGIAKQRIAEQIGSAATKGEGRQNVLCAYLAGALLIGLAGNALVGAWWLDPIVGLLIAGVAVEEGSDAWRGDGCCVGSPLDGFAVASLPGRLLRLAGPRPPHEPHLPGSPDGLRTSPQHGCSEARMCSGAAAARVRRMSSATASAPSDVMVASGAGPGASRPPFSGPSRVRLQRRSSRRRAADEQRCPRHHSRAICSGSRSARVGTASASTAGCSRRSKPRDSTGDDAICITRLSSSNSTASATRSSSRPHRAATRRAEEWSRPVRSAAAMRAGRASSATSSAAGVAGRSRISGSRSARLAGSAPIREWSAGCSTWSRAFPGSSGDVTRSGSARCGTRTP